MLLHPRECAKSNTNCTTEDLTTGSCYWEETVGKSWHDASTGCHDKGGVLAVMSTAVQQSEIGNNMTIE